MKRILTISIVLVCAFVPVGLFAQQYAIDGGHTTVLSKVMRFGVVKVVGRFSSVSGSIQYNPADLSKTSGEIVIKADSYTANNSEGENAVKGEAFLNAKAFPEIKFSIKSLSKSGSGYTVDGSLTLRGVTKPVSFNVSINGPSIDFPTQKQSIGISGIITINRQDFGMTMSRKMPNGQEVIGNEVEIEINALALAN